MSASIVDNEHINAIVNFANRTLGPDGYPSDYLFQEPETLGQMLLNENARSVNHRYNEEDTPPEFIWDRFQRPFTPVQILKAVACLRYQSCETPDWEETPACKILDNIMHGAINHLPGYEDAEWEISAPAPVKGGVQ